MKKSLLALAVLGAFATGAQAQTNVSIGGVIQANIKNYKVSDRNPARVVAPQNEVRIDDDYTSRFWLTGSEDLGGGNSAIFYVENRFNTDTFSANGVANGLANGDTFVGLKGGWGQVTLGKHTMMYTQGLAAELGGNGISAIPSSMWGAFSILSQINGAYITVSRVTNSILYKTPNLSGFTGSVGLSTQPGGTEGNMACTGGGQQNWVTSTTPPAGATANTGCPVLTGTNADYSEGKAYFAQAGYTNGPIYANLAFWGENSEGRVGLDKREVRLSGSYAFPFGLKVGLQADRAKQKSSATGADLGTRTAWQIPLSYTFGPNTILASFTKANDAKNIAGDNGAKMYVLGYDYALSKRTNVGVFYSRLDNNTAGSYQPFLAGTSATGSALAAGETASTFAVGVKHTF